MSSTTACLTNVENAISGRQNPMVGSGRSRPSRERELPQSCLDRLAEENQVYGPETLDTISSVLITCVTIMIYALFAE